MPTFMTHRRASRCVQTVWKRYTVPVPVRLAEEETSRRHRYSSAWRRKISTQLFQDKELADMYSARRPTYPPDLYNFILRLVDGKDWHGGSGTHREKWAAAGNGDNDVENGSRRLCWDVACGSGQATLELCKHFQQVVGTDISESQVAAAQAAQRRFVAPSANIAFAITDASSFPDELVAEGLREPPASGPKDSSAGSASSSLLSPAVVDLVTCATAAHWLNMESFGRECARVVRPKTGVVILWAYARTSFDGPNGAELTHLTNDHFYFHILKDYLKPGHKPVFVTYYKDRNLPETLFEDIYPEGATGRLPSSVDDNRQDGRGPFAISVEWTVREFLAYLRTTSCGHGYAKEHDGACATDLIADEVRRLWTVDGGDPDTSTRKVTWPLMLRAWRKR